MRLLENGNKKIKSPNNGDIDLSFDKLKKDELDFLILETSRKEFVQAVKIGSKFRIELAMNDGFIYSIEYGIREAKGLFKEYLITGRSIFKQHDWKKENFELKSNKHSLIQIFGILGLVISIILFSNKFFEQIDESYSILLMLNSAFLISLHTVINKEEWYHKRTEEKVKSLLILIMLYLLLSLFIVYKSFFEN